MDFHKYQNRIDHRTDDYESEELIIRRGQEFQVTVTFDRVYRPESDQIILQFATGLLGHLNCLVVREDKGDREGIPNTHPIP